MTSEPKEVRIGSSGKTLKEKISDILFGLFFFELHQESLGLSQKYKRSIELLLFAEFLGVPLMTSFITLRLMPYFMKDLERFKEEHLRERDILVELAEHDLH